MDYDVLILGGGIVGCSIAYELSKYSLNIALIEKDYDIANDVAFINSSIVSDGINCKSIFAARLEYMGNNIIRELSSKFNINFQKKDHLIISDDNQSEKRLLNLYEKALSRGIKNIGILNERDVLKIEPDINVKVKKAIYSKNTGIISPYDLAISYGEIAFDNGVNFKLEEEVMDIQSVTKGFNVVTNKNKFTCSMVINTTPKDNYSIDCTNKRQSKKNYINYFLIDNISNEKYNHNVISMLDKSLGMIHLIPIQNNQMVIEITTNDKISYDYGLEIIRKYIGKIRENNINEFYQSTYYYDDVIIDNSLIDKGYVKIIEKHLDQITMTPAIAKIVCETIVNNLKCVLKKDFVDRRREFYRFRDMSNDDRNKIIKVNKKYGKIICYCEEVTEGEIVDSIRRPLGARTIEGIKRRTGATFGNCRGSRCLYKVSNILAREINANMTDIVKNCKNSNILISRVKEFDSI